jgi:hypothetical protein
LHDAFLPFFSDHCAILELGNLKSGKIAYLEHSFGGREAKALSGPTGNPGTGQPLFRASEQERSQVDILAMFCKGTFFHSFQL